jgi:hypothetical protein
VGIPTTRTKLARNVDGVADDGADADADAGDGDDAGADGVVAGGTPAAAAGGSERLEGAGGAPSMMVCLKGCIGARPD